MLNSFEEKLEKLDGFETDYVKLLSYDLKPGYSGTYKSYSYTRFCTILEGAKDLTINHQHVHYDKHQSLLLPPHSDVYMSIKVPTKAMVFELNNELIQQVLDKTTNTIDRSKLVDNDDVLINNLDVHLSESILKLIDSSKDKERLDPFIIDLNAQRLIYDLLKTPHTGKKLLQQTGNPMNRAIQYMTQNLDKPYSGMELAKLMHMSTSNLSHSFKHHTGMSPVKYIHTLKMAEAKKLLTRMNVTETAFELAYESPSYFIHVFKNHFGFTPKKFQQNL